MLTNEFVFAFQESAYPYTSGSSGSNGTCNATMLQLSQSAGNWMQLLGNSGGIYGVPLLLNAPWWLSTGWG